MAPAFLLISLAVCGAGGDTPDVNCGAYCLYVSLRGLDVEGVTFDDVQRKLGSPGRTGYSLGQLAEVAKSYGVETAGVKTTTANLLSREAPFACIALIRESHFVNVSEIEGGQAHIVDPPREYALPLATLSTIWKGEALLLARKPLVPEEVLERNRRVFQYAITVTPCLVVGLLGWYLLRRRRRT